MTQSALLSFAITAIFLVACCLADLRNRRIPNAVTVSAVAVGVLLNWHLAGLLGLLSSVMGFLLMVAVLLGPFGMGGIGGGDVKMMGAVGALMGPKLASYALLSGLIIGGFVMLAHLARIGRLRGKLVSTYRMFAAALLTGSTEPLRLSRQGGETVSLPYSIPLALGTLAVLTAHNLADSL